MVDIDKLPDDPAALKLMIAALDQKLDRLIHELALHRRHIFGRRSEQLGPAQLRLFTQEQGQGELAQPGQGGDDDAESSIAVRSHECKKRGGRQALPEQLPRDRRVLDIPADERSCNRCGEVMVQIGEEVSEQLEYQPGSLFVIQWVRPKYACRKDPDEGVLTAPKPLQPIDKGLPGAGLLAHVVVSKYADHLPLYRQERMLGRHGVQLTRATLCNWMGAAAKMVEPLVGLMRQGVLGSRKINTDDVPVPVQDPGRGTTRTARLWVYIGDADHPYTTFDFTATRSREGPQRYLEGYRGYLQADAYAGYDVLFQSGFVVEVGCWAHARRKFYDARESEPRRAQHMLKEIGRLYTIERDAKKLSPQERCALRREHSAPLLEWIKVWLDEQRLQALPRSAMGQAIGYALGQWTALTRYLDDGILEIDNNRAERALRDVVIGRKNWLFAGSDDGGHWAANLYSLIATCKAHHVEPFAYLRDIFAKLPAWPQERLMELVPNRWAAAAKERAVVATP